jgi:hypothetical protein
MVSHEPVISLSMSDLTGKTVDELGGQCSELESAIFDVEVGGDFSSPKIELKYRNATVQVGEKVFTL